MAEEMKGTGTPASPEGGKQGGIGSWFTGVFFDPTTAFAQIADSTERPHPSDPNKRKDKSKWWVPFLIGLVLAMVVGVLATAYLLPTQVGAIRDALAEQGVPEAQIEQQIAITMRVGPPAAGAIVAIFVVALFFLASAVAHGLSKAMGGKGRFRVARAVIAYSSLVTVLGMLIKLPIMIAKKTPYVEMGPTLFFRDLEQSDLAFRMLMQMDLFMILWVILMVVGLASAYRISRGKAVVPAVGAWIIYLLSAFLSGGSGPSGG